MKRIFDVDVRTASHPCSLSFYEPSDFASEAVLVVK